MVGRSEDQWLSDIEALLDAASRSERERDYRRADALHAEADVLQAEFDRRFVR